MSWVDAQHGWALLNEVESSGTALFATSDGGKTWRSLGVGIGQAAHVKFADLANGWMFSDGFGDPSSFQSTHDGGATWQSIDLTSAGITGGPQGLATDGKTVTIAAENVAGADQNVAWTVATSPVGVDQFARIGIDFPSGAGPVADFSIATSGGNTWVVYNDRVVTGVARVLNGTVKPWTPPWTDLGGPATVAVAKDGGPLYAIVNAGEWGGPVVETQLWVSDDKGDTFQKIALPSRAAPGVLANVQFVPDALNPIVAVTQPDGSEELYRSHADRSNWEIVSTLRPAQAGQVFLADSTTLYSVTPTANGEHSLVMKSTDGGATWQSIVIA